MISPRGRFEWHPVVGSGRVGRERPNGFHRAAGAEFHLGRSGSGFAKTSSIDIQPYGTTQAKERADILVVGGFSDAVFDVIARFVAGSLGADHWVGEIEAIDLS